jgi:lysine/ornithine N-monooxygenase
VFSYYAGIEFKMGQKVTGTSDAGGGKLKLTYEAVKDGAQGEITADIVLVATGRRPVTGVSTCCTDTRYNESNARNGVLAGVNRSFECPYGTSLGLGVQSS